MTKEERAYNLLLRWENDKDTCEGVDCFAVDGYKGCPFVNYCEEARKIVRDDSTWNKKNYK